MLWRWLCGDGGGCVWWWQLHVVIVVLVCVIVVVVVAGSGSGGCICGSGCCMWQWQLYVVVVVCVVVVVACGFAHTHAQMLQTHRNKCSCCLLRWPTGQRLTFHSSSWSPFVHTFVGQPFFTKRMEFVQARLPVLSTHQHWYVDGRWSCFDREIASHFLTLTCSRLPFS